jgi:DnaJ family protein B protein 12
MFDTGPQFVFNLGGGPGIRVHQFGGGRPRRRPREAEGAPETPPDLRSTLRGLLPLLLIFILPIISSLFSGDSSTAAGPQMRFGSPEKPFTAHRTTPKYKVNYYVNPVDVVDYTPRHFSQLDKEAETKYINRVKVDCEVERQHQQRIWDESQGWFYQDKTMADRAKNMEMTNCKILKDMSRLG